MSVSEAAFPIAVGVGGGDFEDPTVSRVSSFKGTKSDAPRSKSKKETSETGAVAARSKKASPPKRISERRAKIFVEKMGEGGW